MYKHGSFGRRFVALMADEVIIAVFASTLTVFSKSLNPSSTLKTENLITLISLTYFILFIWKTGTTPGKKLLHLKVVNQEYKPLSFWQTLLRQTIGYIISGSILNLGFLWILINKRRMAWHDKLAKTFVVMTDKQGNIIPQKAEEKISPLQIAAFTLLLLLQVLPFILIPWILSRFGLRYIDNFNLNIN